MDPSDFLFTFKILVTTLVSKTKSRQPLGFLDVKSFLLTAETTFPRGSPWSTLWQTQSKGGTDLNGVFTTVPLRVFSDGVWQGSIPVNPKISFLKIYGLTTQFQ